jgi:hypothetical protein
MVDVSNTGPDIISPFLDDKKQESEAADWALGNEVATLLSYNR